MLDDKERSAPIHFPERHDPAVRFVTGTVQPAPRARMLTWSFHRTATIISTCASDSRLDRTASEMKYDFNALEQRARELLEAGRPQDAIRIYLFMADGDASLDGGYLGKQLAYAMSALGTCTRPSIGMDGPSRKTP